jgi:hypothetical protein
VQALDYEDNGLAWSQVATFTKSTPAVAPSSPVGGVTVPGTTPFRWAAQAFASTYTLEVYRNNDLTFSAANRVFTATVKTAAYAPSSPIPASPQPYVWRVRKQDSSGNSGPWSQAQAFFSNGVAPSLLLPKASTWVGATSSLFQWTEVPGAASYLLTIVNGSSVTKVTTVATANAPSALKSGKYTWSVTAYDGAGQPLATSAIRSFNVDATAPVVKKITPTTLKPTSTIKATFSEKVRGISGKNIKLQKQKGSKYVKVAAKVTSLKKGKVASIDPKGRLGAGKYRVIFNAAKITDVHGNNLAANSVAQQLRVTVATSKQRTATSAQHRRLPGSGTLP